MILLLSTSDTDLLSARASGAAVPAGQPGPPRRRPTCRPCSTASTSSCVRILGGRRTWEEGLDALLRRRPCRSSCSAASRRPDAELMELSTVPAGRGRRGARLPRPGRPGQPGRAARLPVRHACCSPATASTPPAPTPAWGAARAAARRREHGPDGRGPLLPRPPPGREHRLRRRAVPTRSRPRAAGRCRSSAPRCARRRRRAAGRRWREADALVVTVLAAGGTTPGRRVGAGGDDEAWDVGALADLDVPILQGLCLTSLARGVGGQRRRAVPAGRRDPGRDPGVRRPDHHRAVLVQGDRRRRADRLRRRPRAGRPGGRHRGARTPGCGTSRRPSGGSC